MLFFFHQRIGTNHFLRTVQYAEKNTKLAQRYTEKN